MTRDRSSLARTAWPALVFTALFAGFADPALSQPTTCSLDKVQASGAITRVCMPAPGRWNGDLVVFAHGYVSPEEPIGIPEDQLTLPDGTSLPGILNALGFGFATTSYRKNGLAILPGIEDVKDAVAALVSTSAGSKGARLTRSS